MKSSLISYEKNVRMNMCPDLRNFASNYKDFYFNLESINICEVLNK